MKERSLLVFENRVPEEYLDLRGTREQGSVEKYEYIRWSLLFCTHHQISFW